MFKRLKGHPLICLFGVEICVVLILFLSGFRITYNPKLDNNWEAIAACGTWFCGSVVPIAVIFIEKRLHDNEVKTSSSNLALLEEINNSKYRNNFASETVPEITKDKVYRYICISMTTSTKEIIEHFKCDKEKVIPHLEQLFFVDGRIKTLSLEDNPKNNIENCNWRKA